MKSIKILLVSILFLTGCNSNQKTELMSPCKSSSVQLVFEVEKIYNNYKNSNKDIIQKELHLRLIDTIDLLARDLIGKTGGVKGNGKELFNSCAKIDNLKSVFDDYKVNKIEKLYIRLDKSEKSNEIRKELNEFIYNEKAYFDKSYFQNQNITNLTFDLMTLELILIN